MKNWGTRVGVAYSADDKTVFRAAFAMVYSHGGGTGGAGGAYNGPSQLGFTSSPAYIDGAAGTGAGLAFYLNTSSAFTALGLANANFGEPWLYGSRDCSSGSHQPDAQCREHGQQ